MRASSIRHGPLDDVLGFHIRLADVATTQAFQHAFSGTGITPAQYAALELVASNQGIRPAELAKAIAVHSANLARLLGELEQSGWIGHERSEDRREKCLRISATDAATLEVPRDRLRVHDATLDPVLTPTERAQLSHLIGKLVAGLPPAS